MVKSEIIGRVFRITTETVSGTAFTMECGNRQFLVTAKHLFENAGFPAQATISLLTGKGYQKYCVDIRYPHSPSVDIAVLMLNPYQVLTHFFGNDNTTEGLYFGQDVYFLGFPYHYDQLVQHSPLSNAPVPLIKKACLSSVIKSGDDILLLLDGHNNPGFSGGPVCFSAANRKTMTITGVISGYRYSKEAILDVHDNPQPYYWRENTGIIYAYSIQHAIDVAQKWEPNNA